jgi:lipoprotein-anchoring transpeptidase ErfK/SrfK
MTKTSKFLLAMLSAAIALPDAALGKDRYGEPSAIIVSPDLSAPWVMQLQRTPLLKIRRALPAPVASRQMIVIGKDIQRVKRVQRNVPEPLYNSGVVRIGDNGLIQPQQVAYAKPKMVKTREIDPMFLPQEVAYDGPEKAGTIVIDSGSKFLYLVGQGGTARRYGVGVGKEGFTWRGTQKISNKKEWPDWTPPAEMIQRVREKEGRILPVHMEGGPENPLGARAMYLGSTLYRIHGTNQPWTIGHNVSSGCIRMRNEDVVDLYERVKVGTTVVVQ